jgi:hypothetical protein
MPQIGLRESFKMETRNRYTTVDCEVGMKLDGKELPNMAILGEALEKAIEMIQEDIKKSYEVVPERDGATPHALVDEPKTGLGRRLSENEPAQPQPPKF